MTELTVIGSILGSIKTATEIVKSFKDKDFSLEKAESKLKLAELISALADAKIEVAEMQNVISEKDEQIRKLKNALEIREKLRFEAPYYWLGEGSEKDGPFCQKCYDSDGKLIRLQENFKGAWECKACKSIYTDSNYESQRINFHGSRFISRLAGEY